MTHAQEPTEQETPAVPGEGAAPPLADGAAAAPSEGDPTLPATEADAAQEPAKRPTRREARAGREGGRRRWLLIAGGVAGVALLVLLGLVAYRMLSSQVGAAKSLDAAAVLIEESDSIVVQVDAVVRSDVTTGLAETANVALARVPEAQWQLKDALDLIAQAEKRGSRSDKARAELLAQAANSRLEMLAQGPVILTLNAKASDALPPARTGWETLLAADKTSDEAVAAYNKLTKSGVNQSSKLNKRAATELAKARALFVTAESVFPEAGFDLYIAYIDTRIALNQLSQESDTAWLNKDTIKANEIIARYNTMDRTGITQAQALPSSPENAIADAYEKAAQAATNAYYNARDAATAADEALR